MPAQSASPKALLVDTGTSSGDIELALRRRHIPIVKASDASSAAQYGCDIVVGVLPDPAAFDAHDSGAIARVRKALPFARFVRDTLASDVKRTDSRSVFLTSPDDLDFVPDALNDATRPQARLYLNNLAKRHSSFFVHTAEEWEQALATPLPQRKGTALAFPSLLRLDLAIKDTLRYGENPDQRAALYKWPAWMGERHGVASATQLQGKELSYNNINDTDAAYELVAEFSPAQSAACAIIKHANPCGVAQGRSLLAAYKSALACDRLSAFGGVLAFNRELDEETAIEISKIFTEVIIAPSASPAAIEILKQKKNLRLLLAGGLPSPKIPALSLRSVSGGFLVQTTDATVVSSSDLVVKTERAASKDQIADMVFAFKVAKHVKSNAIVYAKARATIGIGAGQMSRIDSALLGAEKARRADLGHLLKGCVAASDAFFPFKDGLDVIAATGATAVIQPGGSMRDAEVIAAADEAGLAMAFTGVRVFRH